MERVVNFSWRSDFCVFFAAILVSTQAAATHAEEGDTKRPLPNLYPYVASDILEVVGQGALPADDPRASAGVWLRFTKQETK